MAPSPSLRSCLLQSLILGIAGTWDCCTDCRHLSSSPSWTSHFQGREGPRASCLFFYDFLLCSVYFLVKMNGNLFLMSTASLLDLIFIIILDMVLSVSCYYLPLLVFLWGIFFLGHALGTQSWTLYVVYLHWYLLVQNGTTHSAFFCLRCFNTDLLWQIKLYIWLCGCP